VLLHLALPLVIQECEAFAPMQSSPTRTAAPFQYESVSLQSTHNDRHEVSVGGTNQFTRRSILGSVGAGAATTTAVATMMTMLLLAFPQSSLAIPMATADEFGIILRDSPLSVQVVEFSGPKSENVLVRLVDGTTFGIKDVVESSTDPRSPLKVAAACREVGVKTRFVDLEAILAAAPKKKKMYTNQRVQEAQEKERARLERIRNDEEDRLAQLAKMEQEESEAGKQ
jgi:hypothetical protein